MKNYKNSLFALPALALIFLFFTSAEGLFGFGKTEEETVKKHNDKWVLCVTDFDLGSVPEDKHIVASVITKKIVERLNVIDYRVRVSPEYAYYEGYAWAGQRAAAAKALSAKQNERSQLVYRGDSKWVYRRNLEKIDVEIEKLRISLEDVESSAPVIDSEPLFGLTPGNLNFSFPVPPKSGAENKFCADQKADAFLSGEIIDYHGRYYVSIKLYTVYTRSFVYEDDIIFSPDDLERAMDEIAGKLVLALSGGRPSAIAVMAQPEETLVLINRSFAGRGDTGIMEHPPGKLVITASAPDYESMTIETDLSPGELAEIKINLIPIVYGSVEITDPLLSGRIYHGALYIGEPPLTLRLPLNAIEYVELQTEDKKKGTAVFFTPDSIDSVYLLSVKTGIPPAKGRVDKVRRQYYWAWGATWVTGIAAWISTRTFMDADAVLRAYYDPDNLTDNVMKFADNNYRMYYISMGTIIAFSAAAAYSVFQVVRYINSAGKDAAPIVKTDRK